MGEITE